MINLKQVTEAGGALVGGQEDKGDKGDRVDRGDRQGRQGRRPLLLCFVLFSIMLGCISGACSSICQGNLSKQLPTAISGVTLPLSNPHQMSKCFPQIFVSWKLDNCTHIDWFLGDGSDTFDSHLSISAKKEEKNVCIFKYV